MRLSKKELEFIRLAAKIPEGVYDYENTYHYGFLATYGLTKEESIALARELQRKCEAELDKIHAKSNLHITQSPPNTESTKQPND